MQAIYVSSNQFKVSTDKTSEFLAGRRVRALCGSEYKYSTVYSSTYSSPDTTITLEEGELTSNLSEVHYGIVNIGEQGSFPKHSHDGNEGTGGALSLLTLSDTPSVYNDGKYLRSTTSGVEFAFPDDRYYTETEVDTISGTLQAGIDNKSDTNHLHDDRYYTESEIDTISGTLQTNIDTKPDTEVFLVEGVPSNSIGKENDIAVDQETGDVYEKCSSLSYTTYNPSDKSSQIGLSNGNLTATNNTIQNDPSVRSIVGNLSGKYYWEIIINESTSGYIKIGIGNSSANIEDFPGKNTNSYGYGSGGGKYYNNVWQSYGNSYAEGDTISIALDMDNGKVWWAKNGVWQASGDPASETNEAFSGINGTFYSMDSPGYVSGVSVTANFGGSSFLYSVPSGFSAGLGLVTEVEWSKKLSPDFLKLSDTPIAYDNGKYLKSTTSGIDFSDDEIYTKSEVDTISGTLQTDIDTKPDTEVFLVEGVPSNSIGKLNDIAVDQETGDIYEKSIVYGDSNSATFYPAVIADDGYWRDSGAVFGTNISSLVLGNSSGSWGSFCRFVNVNIPQGSNITNAYLKFVSYDNRSGTVNLNIYFNDSDDAVAPTSYSEVAPLTLTGNVAWNGLSSWVDGTSYDSPDIESTIQEVIDRSGWQSNNAMMFLIKDNGSSSNISRRPSAIAHTSGTEKPELHITWEEALEEVVWIKKLSPDFLKLSDTPTTYSGVSGKYLKSTTSGIEFSDDLYTKSEVDTISGSLQTSIDSMPVTFLELEDTPATYSGSEGEYIKTTSSGVEFSQIALLDLSDTPTTYSGASGKYVKTTYSGIEFSDDYHFGDATNYTQIETDGKVHFFGSAQPVNFIIMDSLTCDASHLAPLGLTSLAAADGILTSGLDTATGSSRRIEVVGVDGGVFVKGRDKGSYTQGDTTHSSHRIKIKLNTTNAVWEQSGEWKVILDILSGDIIGDFTVYMPPFSIMEYDSLEGYITVDGATYAEITPRGFDVSLAGPAAAEELFSSNETTGSGIVVEVASTAGFYVGNEVFVSDSSNSEWTRVKEIVTDTSITVDLTNSYTTTNGAKFNIFDYIKTTLTEPIQRGLFRAKVFKADENSGVQLQMPVPQQTDPTKDLGVVLQYVSTVDNPGSSLVSKWRVQYFFKALGEDIPENYQYAELVYVDVTPPVTKCNYIATLATLTQADHQGKNLLAMEVVRLGEDSSDTYTGDFKLVAVITTMPWKQLGYEA